MKPTLGTPNSRFYPFSLATSLNTMGPDYPPNGPSARGLLFFKMAVSSGQRPVGILAKGFWALPADVNRVFLSLGTMQPIMALFFCIFRLISFLLMCDKGAIRKT